MTFKSITKNLMDSTMEGGVLYAAIKGYKIANHMATGILPATITGPIKNVGVAMLYAALADSIAPKKYRTMIGAGAMSEAIAAFVDPFVDPMLIKSNLIGLGALSTLSSYNVGIASGAIAAGTAAPMAGYGRIGGYASTRMGGYGNVLGFGTTNLIGLPS